MRMTSTEETRVPQDHPLRVIRGLVDEALAELSPRFEALYAQGSTPPSSTSSPASSTPMYTGSEEDASIEVGLSTIREGNRPLPAARAHSRKPVALP